MGHWVTGMLLGQVLDGRRDCVIEHEVWSGAIVATATLKPESTREKPVALGDDEASWAQNRRADLIYR